MIESLRFTTRVLGPKAAHRLEQGEVTQTIRSESSSITQAVLSGKLKPGDLMHVVLNNRLIGLAEYLILDTIIWPDLDIDDARRGGFDNRFQLAYALQRAGYRFMPVDKYQFYRCQFTWVGDA
ncbi:hypothetical protein ES703_125729 [subsurface metagenome]